MIDLTNENKMELIKSECDYGNAIDIWVRIFCKCGELKYQYHIMRINKKDIKQIITDLKKR